MSFLWADRKIVACVGTGGVGKTTASAAIAVAAAASGLRTLVMTIDPARRLASALGLTEIGNVEREIPAEHFARHGVKLRAPLWVMMPNPKRIFDDLVERDAPNEQTRQRILRSRIYQHFSSVLAGSHEYAAVQKLHELHNRGEYDLIVLDTPPSQNAVDFLEAPSRMLDFLDTDTMQWLLKPYSLSGKLSLKMLDVGSSLLLKTLGNLAGVETLKEIADFLISFSDMYDGFRERSRSVKELLVSDEIAFTLVTRAHASQRRAALRFRDELQDRGVPVRSIIVNRVRSEPARKEAVAAFSELVEAELCKPESAELVAAAREEQQLAERDRECVERLTAEIGETPLLILPELTGSVHDLTGLAELQQVIVRAS